MRKSSVVQCPHCWAENPEAEDACHACGRTLAIFIGPPEPLRRFSLGSVMLLVALVAVCLAVMRESLGLGLFLLLWWTPSLVRAIHATMRRKADGRPFTREELVGEAVSSLVIILVIGVAAGCAFGVIGFVAALGGGVIAEFWGGGDGVTGLVRGGAVGLALGAVAAGLVAWYLGRRLWSFPE